MVVLAPGIRGFRRHFLHAEAVAEEVQVLLEVGLARIISSADRSMASTSALGVLKEAAASENSFIERTFSSPTSGRLSLMSSIRSCLKRILPDADLMNAFWSDIE